MRLQSMVRNVDYVVAKLDWMRAEGIWPNGLRYLWTDAFGIVNYVSLHAETGDEKWLDAAEALVEEVDQVLGRRRGYRIGEAADRDGQYFHYLAMWMFALARLGDHRPGHREKGVALARDVHSAFVLPGRGVIWKMAEDLSAPYPGYGLGAMDAFDGYVSYRLLDEAALAPEIAEMHRLMEGQYRTLDIDQDLGLGMMLWLAHFFPDEPWARVQTAQATETLDLLWTWPPGHFARASYAPQMKIAFANYGVSLGLQATGLWPERVERLNAHFETWRSGDDYDREAITWVMACSAHLPTAFLKVCQPARSALSTGP